MSVWPNFFCDLTRPQGRYMNCQNFKNSKFQSFENPRFFYKIRELFFVLALQCIQRENVHS